MKNFRDYENLIRECVAKINAEDKTYEWSITCFDECRVYIHWSYFGEKDCKDKFYLHLHHPIDRFMDDEDFITIRDHLDEMIEGYFVHEDPKDIWQTSYENAIRAAIAKVASYAHEYY